MSMKNLKIYETRDIPTRALYLDCKCGDRSNRFDLYCVGKIIHFQCILCNSTYQLINKEVVKAKNINKKIIKKVIKKNKKR